MEKPIRPERIYIPPDGRKKNRYNPLEEFENVGISGNVVDKFDYVIVFPLTEGEFANPEQFGISSEDRVVWWEVAQMWSRTVPGTDQMKEKAVKALSEYWKKRTHSYPQEFDQIRTSAWMSVARDAIIDQLQSRSGLQLKVTSTNDYVLCRIRAPLKLLELQADKDNYRLQLRPEIDPGSDSFWNREVEILEKQDVDEDDPEPEDEDKFEVSKVAVEIENERFVFAKDQANEILEMLYKAKKVSTADIGIWEDVESPSMFSRRVHALERIADQVPVTNLTPAYSSFTTQPHLRYLFNIYKTSRGKSLFLPKDRLFLTKSILDRFFDLEMMGAQKDRIVVACMALHDANRGEYVTVEILKRRWVTFWSATAIEIGGPMLTHPACANEDAPAEWYIRPFCQPLPNIREYFGEKIGLYYAWLGFYTYYLVVPAAMGMALEVVFAIRGYVDTVDNVDWFDSVYLIGLITWAVFFIQGWSRECSAIALKWGTRGYQSVEKDRPQFKGDSEEPLRRSLVTNAKQTYFPESKRALLVASSYAQLIFLLLMNAVVIGSLFYAQSLVMNTYTEYDFHGQEWLFDFVISIEVMVVSSYLRAYAQNLNNAENHRTNSTYEDALINKTLCVHVFTTYGVPLFVAFGKGPLLASCYDSSCLSDLRQFLYVVVIMRTMVNVYSMVYPYIMESYQKVSELILEMESIAKATAVQDAADNLEFMNELDRELYEGTFDDFAEAIVGFGFLALFSVILPVLPIILLLENLVKIRMDAFRLLDTLRRPHVMVAENIGTWMDLIVLFTNLGVAFSVALICFTTDTFDEYSHLIRAIIFLVVMQALIIYKAFVTSFLPAKSELVEEAAERNEFVVAKFVEGFTDSDNVDEMLGTVNLAFDYDRDEVYDLRKAQPFEEKDFAELEECESRHRAFHNEMRLLKEQLNIAYKAETLNENTGIGETKHGLPLGRLTVKVIELEGLSEAAAKKMNVKIRIAINGYRNTGLPAGPPVGPGSSTQKRKLDADGGASFNQVMGPFAPIRTQDADIVFDVIDCDPLVSEASIAVSSIKLRELADQKTHNEVINLKLRALDGSLKPSKARLFVSLLFQYSRVVPIRNRIYSLLDRIRLVEKEIDRIKLHKPKEKEEKA